MLLHHTTLALDYLLAINLLTFLVYGFDKRRSENNQRRVPERTLHALSLFGGWLGALVGQRFFHHKTRKASFQITFLATTIINGSIIATVINTWH